VNSCEYYQELICRLIDGELSEEGRAVLAQHLRECPECAAVYDAFAGISQAMGDDMQEPPADMAANIMAQIRRRPDNSAVYLAGWSGHIWRYNRRGDRGCDILKAL